MPREQLFGIAAEGFRQKVHHRVVRQVLHLIADDRGHLRADIVRMELGVEQPGPFAAGLDDATETRLAVAQGLLQFLARKELVHLLFRDGQSDLQRADVIRLGKKIVGANR